MNFVQKYFHFILLSFVFLVVYPVKYTSMHITNHSQHVYSVFLLSLLIHVKVQINNSNTLLWSVFRFLRTWIISRTFFISSFSAIFILILIFECKLIATNLFLSMKRKILCTAHTVRLSTPNAKLLILTNSIKFTRTNSFYIYFFLIHKIR